MKESLLAPRVPIYLSAGLASFDVRNAAAISGVFELPFGRRKRFLHGTSGPGNALADGWTINSILMLQGGFPFTPLLSYNPSNNGDTRNPVRPFVNPAFTGPVILAIRTSGSVPPHFLRCQAIADSTEISRGTR